MDYLSKAIVPVTVFVFSFFLSGVSEGLCKVAPPNVGNNVVESHVPGSRVVLGILWTKNLTTKHEVAPWGDHWVKVFRKLGADNVVAIDYNLIMKDVHVRLDSEGNVLECDREKINRRVSKLFEVNGINRVLIPGDFYNYDSEPRHPTPNRQLVSDAVMRMVDACACKVRLMAICGGLEYLLHSDSLSLRNISDVEGPLAASKHFVSERSVASRKGVLPSPIVASYVVPGTLLSDILERHGAEFSNGWGIMYVPEAHHTGLILDTNVNEMLSKLGYKVVAFSEDGVLEAVQDRYGFIHFQGHPEFLLVEKMLKKLEFKPGKKFSKAEARLATERNEKFAAVFEELMQRFLISDDYGCHTQPELADMVQQQ